MFYSQFILAKKGPLGTIWIAAHLERKLRKNQVADTDIGVSVDSILFPDAPIALRLSSHLLLGVVRIYSKKVNYLFDDCSEALLKVKQAFRSTAVDLPPEESTAPYHSITLPETFDLDDFEIPDTDILRGNFVDHHVSTKEQITLQESVDGTVFSTSKFGLDERFGDGDTSHVPLDFEEDLLLGKIASQFDEISEIKSTVSNPSTVFVGSSINESDVPDYEAQAPSTPGLVSEPNIITVQKGCDATSEDNNYILEENEEGVEIMNVDTGLKSHEDSECVLRPCTSARTENKPVLESVLYPEFELLSSVGVAEPVKLHSELEDGPLQPLSVTDGEMGNLYSESEVEPVKSFTEPEVEPVKPFSEPEAEPVNSPYAPEAELDKLHSELQVDLVAEPVESPSEPVVEPVKTLFDTDAEPAESLTDPETDLVKFRPDPEDSRMESTNINSDLGDSPVEPVSLVSKTTPETVSTRSKGAKRKFLERLDSATSEGTVFKDNDLLSTILAGRRSSIGSKPSANQEMSHRKRAKTTPRVNTVKRKVLVDDSMGLLGDTIRKQLASTADIRRLRKKAPCTPAEIASVQRLLIDDEIFCEAVLLGTASDLRLLHSGKLDLSAIQMEDIGQDEFQAPDRDENQEEKDDKILEEVAYHGHKCAGDTILVGSEQESECIVEKSDNPEDSIAIPVLDECRAPGDLNSSANELPEEHEGEERAPIDEPNGESTISEPQQVEVGEPLDEAGCAFITDDAAVDQNNGEILEDSFIGNNTEFLTIDDDDDDVAEGDADDGEPLDNCGWSSRTRAVANYLQQLFNKETKYERNALSVNTLLTGKTTKEASRMFFETLVLKTKDYIHVEQGKPYEQIHIKPRVRLLKSEF